MAKLIYQRPGDQLLDGFVTITPSTSPPTGYGTAGLFDSNPAKAYKLGATSGNVVFDFGSAVSVDLFAIIHHNLDAGLEVRLQGNATDSWGAPSLNELITVPAYEADGFPVNPWKDLTGIASRSFRYWRLYFPNANGAQIQLGQLWFGETKRSLVHNISWGYTEGVERRIIEHETDYGVSTIYDLGAKIKNFSPEIRTSDAGMLAIEQWWDSCRGRSLPSLVILDPAVNDARLVRFAEPARTISRDFKNDNVVQLGLREVSRGLVF